MVTLGESFGILALMVISAIFLYLLIVSWNFLTDKDISFFDWRRYVVNWTIWITWLASTAIMAGAAMNNPRLATYAWVTVIVTLGLSIAATVVVNEQSIYSAGMPRLVPMLAVLVPLSIIPFTPK